MPTLHSNRIPNQAHQLLVDAGVESFHIFACNADGQPLQRWELPASGGLTRFASELQLSEDFPVYSIGKLSSVVQRVFTQCNVLDHLAVLWAAARQLTANRTLAIVELSASGYAVAGIAQDGSLKENLLLTNPRCGAGTGINLDRILQKLNLQREQVDFVLQDFLGKSGAIARSDLQTRADRCGVFASSATVSDKNQGIPVDFALATTLKSEVLKACKNIDSGFDIVWLTGGVFRWQFCRDVAEDYFATVGVNTVAYDEERTLLLQGMLSLLCSTNTNAQINVSGTTKHAPELEAYPAFAALHASLAAQSLFQRTPAIASGLNCARIKVEPVLIGIDVGSTMAKLVISSQTGDQVLYRAAYSNAGDTVETIKTLFLDLKSQGLETLNVAQIGVTGSARYQVQKLFLATYPTLVDRVLVLVENYAHARGSVELAQQHLSKLQHSGIKELNEEFYVLVDVGGEDTKISTVSLHTGELYDNAMNIKCSAGTGSLLDTLVTLFKIDDIETAVEMANTAAKAYRLNATCAVFLLEHARKLQAEGCSQAEILAAAVWAIVENMARSLWPLLELPGNSVVLLHGQTMQGDPLPLAVADRLSKYLGAPAYCLVPPDPGYRACLGLIRTLVEQEAQPPVILSLAELIGMTFEKRIIKCQGAACGDALANCHRAQLSGVDAEQKSFRLQLGGCSAINEWSVAKADKKRTGRDAYRDIWQFIKQRMPVSDAGNRLVIPRSFAVSEWGLFFAELFTPVDIPVHVDTVQEVDILRGQPFFQIDTCAPHIGVVGQFMRLAEQPHGIILAPQIEFLPINGTSLSRTCTVNQGGLAVATGLAEKAVPHSQIHLFYLDLKTTDANMLAHKLYLRLLPVYQHYGVEPSFAQFSVYVQQAMQAQQALKASAAEYAAGLARQALDAGGDIALVVGREYILNPGVFDSHVGSLLRDKGLTGIPSYVLDIDCAPKFAHLYWRNAHQLATLAGAVSEQSLHQVVRNPGLRKVFQTYESDKQRMLPTVQVSTFLCGPDSVTNPLVNQLVKKRPYLRLQSDAAIKELAHLENRMNTYVKQLLATGQQRISTRQSGSFDVQLLDSLVNREKPNPETDVICFPTLADNRPLLAVLRSAGFTCLENYDDDYRLQSVIERGRAVTGDSVCAPLAAVYGDVLIAIETFRQRRNDPVFQDKKRLLIFNNKGLGPCRQGQYVESHKIYLQQGAAPTPSLSSVEDAVVQFLISHENEGFNTGFSRGVFFRGVQAVILQGVLHQLLADGVARCRDAADHQKFMHAYAVLKSELIHRLESWRPSNFSQKLIKIMSKVPGMGQLVVLFAYVLHRNPLLQPLRKFRNAWCVGALPADAMRIHVDGEAYMRTAQFEEVHQCILEILGLRRFIVSHTPVWSFLEYKIAGMLMRSREGIAESRNEIRRGGAKIFIRQRRKFLRKKQQRYAGLIFVHLLLRKILAAPLYRAAGVTMPESMPKVLEVARKVISTRRPGGELIPFVGETVIKLQQGYDLVLNIAPEGCMVSSMGEVITPAIYNVVPDAIGKVQPLFSQQGDVDREQILLALLKSLGPGKIYR